MISFFSVMTIISTVVALITSIIFAIGILVRSQTVTDSDVFNTCNNQMKICRIFSVVLIVLSWFVISGFPEGECLAGYEKLSVMCSELGRVWIIAALVNIVLSILFGILKREKDDLEIMGKLRKSSFFMGAIFLIISFILKVE